MAKKYNDVFMDAFMELDKLCCSKFGVKTGGVTEYINQLNKARFAPSRDEVLPRLVKYRNLRNCFAHEPGVIRRSDDITKDDIRWINHFRQNIILKRDPISKYLRRARIYAFTKKSKKLLFVLLGVLAVAAVAAIISIIRNLAQ